MTEVRVWRMEPLRCTWGRRHVPTDNIPGDFFIRNLRRCQRCKAAFTPQYPGVVTGVWRSRGVDGELEYMLRARPTWWSKAKVLLFGDGRA